MQNWHMGMFTTREALDGMEVVVQDSAQDVNAAREAIAILRGDASIPDANL